MAEPAGSGSAAATASAIGLGLLALMASGPFLFPLHTFPITSFWSEWWAVALGLAAAITLLAAHGGRLPFPITLGIPAALLLALLLQFAVRRLVFPEIGLIYAAYILWAGLLVVLGRRLADTFGLDRLAELLAATFALGALAGSAIAIVQWLGASAGLPWLFPHLGGGAYGNLGQPNHHVHHCWLGIASVLYLRARGWLGRATAWTILMPILLGSVLGASRSVFLYPVVVLAASAWARRTTPAGQPVALLADAVLLLPAVVALSVGVAVLAPIPEAPVHPLGRLFESVSGGSVRLALVRAAMSAFVEHPWLGQGAGNFAWASFSAAAAQSADAPVQVAEHAHNVVLQGLAEFGAPATVAVTALLLFWARRFLARPWGPGHVWCGAVLGIGAVHALLEYPYWYTYFLGPTALLIGATDSGRAFTLGGRRAAAYLAFAGIGGVAILAGLRADYAAIEAASYRPLAAHANRETAWRMSMDRLRQLHRESLLAPWALLAFANLSQPSSQLAPERAMLCERGIRLAPVRPLVAGCAIQLAIAGRTADGTALARAALNAFPAEATTTRAELARAAAEFPEVATLWRSMDDGANASALGQSAEKQ